MYYQFNISDQEPYWHIRLVSETFSRSMTNIPDEIELYNVSRT